MPNTASKAKTRIGVVMGSSSDWDTMQHAVQILQQFGIDHEAKVVSAHRMPDEMFTYAETAMERGLFAIIAGAGGAAHLPGMLAARTVVPVLGVPVASKHLQGVDSLHSIVQMPQGHSCGHLCDWRSRRRQCRFVCRGHAGATRCRFASQSWSNSEKIKLELRRA
jgi:5-(carboxyamino)imidazole ribonucleotide mutase